MALGIEGALELYHVRVLLRVDLVVGEVHGYVLYLQLHSRIIRVFYSSRDSGTVVSTQNIELFSGQNSQKHFCCWIKETMTQMRIP